MTAAARMKNSMGIMVLLAVEVGGNDGSESGDDQGKGEDLGGVHGSGRSEK